MVEYIQKVIDDPWKYDITLDNLVQELKYQRWYKQNMDYMSLKEMREWLRIKESAWNDFVAICCVPNHLKKESNLYTFGNFLYSLFYHDAPTNWKLYYKESKLNQIKLLNQAFYEYHHFCDCDDGQ